MLADNAGIREEFGVKDHPQGFALAVSASEHDVVRECEWFEFDAPTAFWTGGSVRKRKPISPMRPELPGPLDGLLIGSRIGSGATIDGIGHRGESDRSALGFLEDKDKGVGIALPY